MYIDWYVYPIKADKFYISNWHCDIDLTDTSKILANFWNKCQAHHFSSDFTLKYLQFLYGLRFASFPAWHGRFTVVHTNGTVLRVDEECTTTTGEFYGFDGCVCCVGGDAVRHLQLKCVCVEHHHLKKESKKNSRSRFPGFPEVLTTLLIDFQN